MGSQALRCQAQLTRTAGDIERLERAGRDTTRAKRYLAELEQRLAMLQAPRVVKPPPKPQGRRPNLREVWAIRTGRASRRRACSRKHAFSQDRAIRIAEKRSLVTGHTITAYPCLYCAHWHIGHTPGVRV